MFWRFATHKSLRIELPNDFVRLAHVSLKAENVFEANSLIRNILKFGINNTVEVCAKLESLRYNFDWNMHWSLTIEVR